MGKFNVDKIMGKDNKVGAGLLNTQSQKGAKGKMKIEYLPFDKIVPNGKNSYSMDNIESLASLIYQSGLKQPLTVKPCDDNGEYVVTTGHRRLEAIGKLQLEGKWESGVVPCVIEDTESLNLPLNSELKEMYAILVTNQYRDKTDGDKLMEIRHWKKIITELKANGITDMPEGLISDPSKEPNKIKGKKTREIVAEQMQESPAQIGKYEKVENNGTDKLKSALESDLVTIAQATDIASLDTDLQNDIVSKIESTEETLTKKAIKDLIKNATNKECKEDAESIVDESTEEILIITKESLTDDLSDLIKIVENKPAKLSREEFVEYYKHIKGLLDILSV
ncbi:MAG: ParB/RepB/Spo0J family partition protein [Suipraeoptans sp.]